MSMLSDRSELAEKLLPAKGLFHRTSGASARSQHGRLALHVLPLPLLLRGLQNSGAALVAVAIVALFIASVWVLGEGMRAEDDWRARAVAKAPRMKLKLVSALMMGAAVGLSFITGGTDVLGSVLGGVLAAGLHLTSFGIDPMRDKQGEGITAFEAERIDGMSDALEPHLARISASAEQSGDVVLRSEARALNRVVNQRMQALKSNPVAAASARKMVAVWLPALATALQQGVQLEAVSHSDERVDRLGAAMADVRLRIEAMVVVTQAHADQRLESDLAALRSALG